MENVYTEDADFDVAKALAERGLCVDALSFADSENSGPSTEHVGVVVGKLQSLYPDAVTLPNSSSHSQWRSNFWSLQQREAIPACIFHPQTTDQVTTAILLCRWARCKFAVKSGGHAAMKGGSSGDGGITIDLKRLSGIALSEDRKLASIGAGARWGDVYRVLEKEGLAVVGGRHSDVGAGGISLFASLYGWACDTVANFELVTAAGQVLDVNQHSYPDIFWALRGAGSNFGIVTRFDMETFPLGDIFAGIITYDHATQGNAVLSAFAQLAAPNVDPKASSFLIIVKDKDTRFLSLLASYADPITDAAVFQPYRSIPSLADPTKITTLVDFTEYLKTTLVNGHRQMYWTNTYKLSAPFISWFVTMFFDELDNFERLEKGDYHHRPIPYFQILTKDCVSKMQRNGGNCLPLTVEDAPYVNLVYACEWQDSQHDAAVTGLQRQVMEKAVEEGRERGVFVEYVYMNYASEYQDVMKGFGEKNGTRLRSISERCDPERVFQRLMPGYFRFGGAPRIVV
ncbi:FAD binding domain protein [Lophiotrema nucula]|uniref:FAD binding domain protein n=1 Tax=Lophiotrema nucula TaxID=690887 RepID=A0A6A5ZV91_9PLEO|nr:FAD binding domain protein [Lophiotrema nucula]